MLSIDLHGFATGKKPPRVTPPMQVYLRESGWAHAGVLHGHVVVVGGVE